MAPRTPPLMVNFRLLPPPPASRSIKDWLDGLEAIRDRPLTIHEGPAARVTPLLPRVPMEAVAVLADEAEERGHDPLLVDWLHRLVAWCLERDGELLAAGVHRDDLADALRKACEVLGS